MLCTVSSVDMFGGASVSSVYEHTWPFSRATLEISADAVARVTPSGRRTARERPASPTVTITRYRYVPLCVQTIVWIDRTSRVGFAPYRWRAVRDSLEAHGWSVEIHTKSWRTVVSDARFIWRTYIDTGEFPPP
jgi:hypothetical protein